MARGRHSAPRSGLLARLRPGRNRRGARTRLWTSRRVRWTQQEQAVIGLRSDLHRLEAEMAHLRLAGAQSTAAAAEADRRATRAEDALVAATVEMAGLRTDLASLREELVWAFAERKVAVEERAQAEVAAQAGAAGATGPAHVIDLRSAGFPTSATA